MHDIWVSCQTGLKGIPGSCKILTIVLRCFVITCTAMALIVSVELSCFNTALSSWISPKPNHASHTQHLTPIDKYAVQELKRHTCLRNTRNTIINAFEDIFVGKRYVALVDVPTHENFGDTFLWAGENRLSQYFGYEIGYVCAHCQGQASNLDRCHWVDMAKLMKRPNEWLVLYHGGGNWGTLWNDTHSCRMNLLRDYLSAGLTVVSMPQSVYYDLNTSSDKNEFAKEQAFWEEEAPRLPGKMIVACRQHDSCAVLAKHFPKLDIRPVPDIAFMIPPVYVRSDPVIDILFLIRTDKESVAGHTKNLDIINARLNGTVKYEVYDWPDLTKFLPIRPVGQISADPTLKIQVAAEALSRAKVIITDRLHCSIMSLLMGKHHIYIDNSYHKLEQSRQLALSHETCTEENVHGFKATDMDEAVEMAIKRLKAYDSAHCDTCATSIPF